MFINVNDLKRFKKNPIPTEEEIRKEYFDHINKVIYSSYKDNKDSVEINVDNEIYDTYQLKRDLKASGYKVSIYKKYDNYYMRDIPYKIVVSWE